MKKQEQKAGESFQEFKVDVTSLVPFVYPFVQKMIIECLAMQASVDDVRHDEI